MMMKMITMMMLHNMMGKNDTIEEKNVSNKLKQHKEIKKKMSGYNLYDSAEILDINKL